MYLKLLKAFLKTVIYHKTLSAVAAVANHIYVFGCIQIAEKHLDGIEHLHYSLRWNYCILYDFYTDITACGRKACDKAGKKN